MPEANVSPPPMCMGLPDSDELLWEWDLATDTLHLSQGARAALGLATSPATMAALLGLMDPEAARGLGKARARACGAVEGPAPACDYRLGQLWVREHPLVLARDAAGNATRVLCRLEVTRLQQGSRRPRGGRGNRLLPVFGLWLYSPLDGRIWRDAACNGFSGGAPCPRALDFETGTADVHPAEREALRRHYELFLRGDFTGDTITDILRLRQADGSYAPMLVRASVLERDARGRIVLMGGIITPAQPAPCGGVSPEEEHLVQALSVMGSGQWSWDTRSGLVFFCPRCRVMLGDAQESGPTSVEQWRERIHPDDRDKVLALHTAVISSPEHGDTFECTYRMRRADGGWAWLFDRSCVIWRDADGTAGHLVGSITNITTAQAERDRLEELVRRDMLTGLRSRAFCNLEMEHAEQNGVRPVCIIAGDVTGLKMINDNLGHALGDELLTKAASLLRGSLRASDCVARMGGDEFLVFLPRCPLARGEKLLAKIEARFAEYNSRHGRFPVYAAFGLACAESMEERMRDALARADEAMRHKKRRQRPAAHAAIRDWIRALTGNEVGADERISDV